MINSAQVRKYIVKPVLEVLAEYNQKMKGEVAENLILGTFAMESEMGTYIHQIGGGPALGIGQMEPATHDDIWHNYIDHRPYLKEIMQGFQSSIYRKNPSKELMSNLAYVIAMTRVHYWRSPVALPKDHTNIEGLAKVWKKVYNTHLGAHDFGTAVKLFCKKYNQYVINGF